jgi:hypothetical protein
MFPTKRYLEKDYYSRYKKIKNSLTGARIAGIDYSSLKSKRVRTVLASRLSYCNDQGMGSVEKF